MFVKKTRHFIEFTFILLVVCALSFLLMKFLFTLKNHYFNELEFNPDSDFSQIELLDEN